MATANKAGTARKLTRCHNCEQIIERGVHHLRLERGVCRLLLVRSYLAPEPTIEVNVNGGYSVNPRR